MRPRRRILAVTAAVFLLLLAFSAVLLWEPPAPQAPIVTAKPAELEYPRTPWLDRIPQNWGWLWRLRDRVFPRKVITVRSQILQFEGMPDQVRSNLPSPIPGPWVSDDFELRILTEGGAQRAAGCFESAGARVLTAPGVTTADRIQAQAMMGGPVVLAGTTRFAGVEVLLYPRILNAGTDLTLAVTMTAAVTNKVQDTARSLRDAETVVLHTNLVVGARVLVPRQGSLLLLKHAPADSEEASYGLLLSVDVPSHRQ